VSSESWPVCSYYFGNKTRRRPQQHV